MNRQGNMSVVLVVPTLGQGNVSVLLVVPRPRSIFNHFKEQARRFRDEKVTSLTTALSSLVQVQQ